MKKLTLTSKLKRTLAYVGIIGGCAILALTFFSISQFNKAKFQASTTVELTAKSHINKEYFERTKTLITRAKDAEDDITPILEPLALSQDDFVKYDIESSVDVENAFFKVHEKIYAIEGAENYETRYNVALPIFGTALSTYLANDHSEANFWIFTYKDFINISKANSAAYVGTAIPAYIFSMATLVAFGLVLKHAEKTKEKEEKEV